MDRVLPPQVNDRVDVDIVVVEAKSVSGIEDLHSLDPPHEDLVGDPGVHIPDHLVDVVVTVSVCQMAGIATASGKEVPGQWSHDDNPLALRRLDTGYNQTSFIPAGKCPCFFQSCQVLEVFQILTEFCMPIANPISFKSSRIFLCFVYIVKF